MKKINYLFGLIFIASVFMFSSCTEDGDALGPVITFKAGTGLITSDATVSAGESFTFSWEVNRGDAALDEFTIRLGAIDEPGFPVTGIDRNQYESTYTTSLSTPGDYTYTFIATDNDDLQDVVSITITVSETIATYNVTLGSYDSPTGSSFVSLDGSVYTSAQAASNSDEVDLLFYYGASNLATIASPDNATAESIFSGLSSWATQNATRMKEIVMSATDFNAISDGSAIADSYTSSASAAASQVIQLAVGDVFAFETGPNSANSGKVGIARVTGITGTGGTATIELTIKVQL